MTAMRNANGETDDLTLVAAHRGYWEFEPENSWPAIFRAGFTCRFEIVEVDVKPAKDAPVVFHDYELERVTNGHGLLSEITAQAFTGLLMRDRHGLTNLQTGSLAHPMTTRSFLAQYGAEMMKNRQSDGRLFGPVIAFDMKAENTADVWGMVKTVCGQITAVEQEQIAGSLQGVVFKVESRSMPGLRDDVVNLAATCPSLKMIIVLNPPRDGEAPDINDKVIDRFAGLAQIVSYEVNYRYPGDPMGRYLTDARLRSVGTFSNYYELPEGFGSSRARCCFVANTDDRAVRTPGQPLDYRGRWDWYLSRDVEGGRRFNLITTDRPDLAVVYLERLGLRHTDRLQ
ncbi:MAG: hypothetical protein KKA16_00545 [Alphaproteobacteria bacterium]|nr:hypothetical protein [Alphaproteobacteria bacterium]